MTTVLTPTAGKLAEDVRAIYAASPSDAEKAIENLLHQRLDQLPLEQRLQILANVYGVIKQSCRTPSHSDIGGNDEFLSGICSLLLGRQVDTADIDPGELSQRLAQSINTVFDALNKVIGVINKTLSRDHAQAEKTIRRVIGDHLEGDAESRSLEEHLDQIADAFLKVHEAFKAAAQAKVKQILDALDPSALASERSGGIKIGPLRKAEDYEILVEKIERIRKWFDSGKFMEELLREFERNCQ